MIHNRDMKLLFSKQLALCIRKFYKGRMPSLAILARDMSLRAPHLPHASNEAVRKWLRGDALPQSPRMQALAEWLGDELVQPLGNGSSKSNGNAAKPNGLELGYTPTPWDIEQKMILAKLNQLSRAELRLVEKLIDALLSKNATNGKH